MKVRFLPRTSILSDSLAVGCAGGDLVGHRFALAWRARNEGDSKRAISVRKSVSEWELAIKAALGKVTLRRSLFEAALDAGFEPLAITFQHAQTVRSLKPIH
jgi:PIN domain nuclease of toxin-antitoxin system